VAEFHLRLPLAATSGDFPSRREHISACSLWSTTLSLVCVMVYVCDDDDNDDDHHHQDDHHHHPMDTGMTSMTMMKMMLVSVRTWAGMSLT
jgi:hypothetical protein